MIRASLVVALSMIVAIGCSGGAGMEEGADDTGDGYGTESALTVNATLRATTAVNLRSGPSTSNAILHVIPAKATVTVVSATPKNGFYNVKHESVVGWAYGIYFENASEPTSTSIAKIESIAASSQCYQYAWKNRGQAPKGYVEGVALVFAKAVCDPNRSDVVVASQAKTSDTAHDALAWYASTYAGLGMSNATAGLDTLRHVYTLLLGLGMRESSGEHCIGRDTSASNYTSSSAEAGAWQTSWDSHTNSVELPKLFAKYKASSDGCFLDPFQVGVTCSASDWQNWGAAGDGFDFQRIEKACPAFAAEYAAVMLRVSGGSAGHYGPLRTRAAEVRPECDAMFQQVQSAVSNDPSVCSSL